jgi:hypothetical protein
MADLIAIFKENPRNPGYCLVLRPFGGDHERVWAEIKRALEQDFAWTDVRSLQGAGEIMDEVLCAIARTDVVIVDVTGVRPNVFYELGIAHCAKGTNKVLILKQTSTEMPFDLQAYRYLEYTPTEEGLSALVPELKSWLEMTLEPTFWFPVPAGQTYVTSALRGTGGMYCIDVRVVALSRETVNRHNVHFELTVRRHPSQEAVNAKPIDVLLSNQETYQVPALPWHLKFEYLEKRNGQEHAIICAIRDNVAQAV